MSRPYRASSGVYIVAGELVAVGAAAREDCGAALRPEGHGLVHRLPQREPVREPGGEAVAAAVGVGDRAWQRRGAERPTGTDPAAEGAGRGDDDGGLRVELAGLEPRGDVAADEVGGGAPPELLPGQRAVLARGQELLAEHGDRPLACLVDVGERAALRAGCMARVHRDASRLQLL